MLSPAVICLYKPYEMSFLSLGMESDHAPAALTSAQEVAYCSSVDMMCVLKKCVDEKERSYHIRY